MKRILIVEDESDVRSALQTMLVEGGYRVDAVGTSEEGLKLILSSEKPDLILLDVMTRSMHAAVFLERLRELPVGKNDSKVIILTNLDNDITREKVKKYGVDAYLVKAQTSLEEVVKKVGITLGTQESSEQDV